MKLRHRKVRAYITRGTQLLVFRHTQHPEAGIQVPGGTVEEGEDWAAAVLREAGEETGIQGLRLVRFLGMIEYREQGVRVHYYHLACDGQASESWRHWESTPSDGSGPIEFEFFWSEIAHAATLLVPWNRDYLHDLQRSLTN